MTAGPVSNKFEYPVPVLPQKAEATIISFPSIPNPVTRGLVAESVLADIDQVRARGVDVSIVSPEQPVDDPYKRLQVREAIAHLALSSDSGEELVTRLFDPAVHPTGSAWLRLSKRAIALGPLYAARTTGSLAEQYNFDAFDQPLFDGRSARDIMALRYHKPGQADRILEKYKDYFNPAHNLQDGEDIFGLTSGDYLTHVHDAYSVRSRGGAAGDIIVRHFADKTEIANRGGLVLVSMACGAADPMYKTVRQLQEQGVLIKRVLLADQDPMALASAAALANYISDRSKPDVSNPTGKKLPELIDLRLHDLVRDDIAKVAEPHSADAVDLLGLFEYFPASITFPAMLYERLPKHLRPAQPPEAGSKAKITYKPAADILSKAGKVVRPGGIIVFGNMLQERPEQKFFSSVWPPLKQRSIPEVLDIIEDAGFDLATVSVDVPEDGVYAIYTIRVPEEGGQTMRPPSVLQRVGGAILKLGRPTYY